MGDFLDAYNNKIKVIEFLEDLSRLINCQNKSDFPKLFFDLRNKHYPKTSLLETFLVLFPIVKKQADKNSLYNYIFNFVENRLFFVEKDFATFKLCYELLHIIMLLREDVMLSEEELTDMLEKLAGKSDEEKWQYIKVHNSSYWNTSPDKDTELLSKLQNLLDNKDFNSMFFCDSRIIENPSGKTSEFIVQTEQGKYKLDISPNQHTEIWKRWSKYSEPKSNFVRFSSPFSVDTNHMDGAGLFYLVASVDLNKMRESMPDFSLFNTTLAMRSAMNFLHEGNYHVHIGIGAEEKDSSGNLTGMSSWWLHKSNIYSENADEKRIIRNDNPDDWLYMDRNKYSFPYFKYKFLPINYALKNAHSLFFIIKQEPNTKIIEGFFDIFEVSISWNIINQIS